MKRCLLVVAVFLLGLASQASAGIALNTIDRHVTYDWDGARVRSAGPIACTLGERITIRVRIQQAATRARSRWSGRCTGEAQRWRVRARAGGKARFAQGSGTVCAVATTRAGQRVTDARRWCRRVSVSKRGSAVRAGGHGEGLAWQ
jgi:hypothetical protein